MWMFRGVFDWRLLEDRLSRMGLVSEWMALGRMLWSIWGCRWMIQELNGKGRVTGPLSISFILGILIFFCECLHIVVDLEARCLYE